jgi:hypothetical protein
MSNISDRLNKMTQTLNSPRLAQVGYTEFLKVTPIKTGNAKRSTSLQGTQIRANYPYADVLDQGRGFRDGQMRGSEQAPEGMTKPTIEAIRNYVYQQTGMRLK